MSHLAIVVYPNFDRTSNIMIKLWIEVFMPWRCSRASLLANAVFAHAHAVSIIPGPILPKKVFSGQSPNLVNDIKARVNVVTPLTTVSQSLW